MNAGHARQIARQWVDSTLRELPGVEGAFLSGSICSMPDETILPESSDVDIFVIAADSVTPPKKGKFLHQGVILEVGCFSPDKIGSVDTVLGNHFMAGNLLANHILLDPSGRLKVLQAGVARGFAEKCWVLERCRSAWENGLVFLDHWDSDVPFDKQVSFWLIGGGALIHVLLVADLRNPTVRNRYSAVRQVLVKYNRLDLYERLLDLLGCARLTRKRVEIHLQALEKAFDAAVACDRTQYRFGYDLSDVARPVAIGGSRALIESGSHREAVFWMAVTFSRCLAAFRLDSNSGNTEPHHAAFRRLLKDLGIEGTDCLDRALIRARQSLPDVWEAAERIIELNPEIR